jgi:hypothetical protein
MGYDAGKFNQQSYDENDNFAKVIFSKHLESEGYKVLPIVEDYGIDLLAEKDGVIFYFELEVKTRYPFTTVDTFKFATVSFLARKKKMHNKQPFVYVIICRETEWALMCSSSEIFKEEYEEFVTINTTRRKGVDKMYRVPKEQCKFFKLTNTKDEKRNEDQTIEG